MIPVIAPLSVVTMVDIYGSSFIIVYPDNSKWIYIHSSRH